MGSRPGCGLRRLPATPPAPHGPLRVNGSALEAAGQFTLLPGLYKNTSFEVWGEAAEGKTWWRTEPGAGPVARTSLPGSLRGRDRAPSLPGDPPAGRASSHIPQLAGDAAGFPPCVCAHARTRARVCLCLKFLQKEFVPKRDGYTAAPGAGRTPSDHTAPGGCSSGGGVRVSGKPGCLHRVLKESPAPCPPRGWDSHHRSRL